MLDGAGRALPTSGRMVKRRSLAHSRFWSSRFWSPLPDPGDGLLHPHRGTQSRTQLFAELSLEIGKAFVARLLGIPNHGRFVHADRGGHFSRRREKKGGPVPQQKLADCFLPVAQGCARPRYLFQQVYESFLASLAIAIQFYCQNEFLRPPLVFFAARVFA